LERVFQALSNGTAEIDVDKNKMIGPTVRTKCIRPNHINILGVNNISQESMHYAYINDYSTHNIPKPNREDIFVISVYCLSQKKIFPKSNLNMNRILQLASRAFTRIYLLRWGLMPILSLFLKTTEHA